MHHTPLDPRPQLGRPALADLAPARPAAKTTVARGCDRRHLAAIRPSRARARRTPAERTSSRAARRPRRGVRRRRTAVSVLAAVLLPATLGACGPHARPDDRPTPATATPGLHSAAPTTARPAPMATATPAGDAGSPAAAGATGETGPPCAGGPDAEIPAVEVPAVHVAPVTVPDQELDGHPVPGFSVGGIDLPADRIAATCVRYDAAPAGCLGEVTIPARTIPAVTLPALTIPAVDVPGAHAGPAHRSAVTRPAVIVPAATRPAVCSPKRASGALRAPIVQPALGRAAAMRGLLYRQMVDRPRVCLNGECLPAVTVPAVTVEPVVVPPVAVESRALEFTALPEISADCVSVWRGAGQTAYRLCADVLFAFDRAGVRPRAARALREVAASIAKRYPGRALRVEGHTDAAGAPAYNQRLSTQRAAAVKRWLVEHAHIAARRISTHGYGETRPAATNASTAGRARNRRVVIGVAAS
jgi:outer membrane protein OmpA-like peptidoglycan-associated protein